MEEIISLDRVILTRDKSIHAGYGYLVEVDGEDKGAIVGIDCECGLVFESCMPLRGFELLAIASKIDEKEGELFRDGLLG